MSNLLDRLRARWRIKGAQRRVQRLALLPAEGSIAADRRKAMLFGGIALFGATGTAKAQFSNQRNYVGSSGGSANAQTLAVANYGLNLGVPVRGLMSFTKTGPLTLNTNGTGVITVKKQTSSGLVAGWLGWDCGDLSTPAQL